MVFASSKGVGAFFYSSQNKNSRGILNAFAKLILKDELNEMSLRGELQDVRYLFDLVG